MHLTKCFAFFLSHRWLNFAEFERLNTMAMAWVLSAEVIRSTWVNVTHATQSRYTTCVSKRGKLQRTNKDSLVAPEKRLYMLFQCGKHYRPTILVKHDKPSGSNQRASGTILHKQFKSLHIKHVHQIILKIDRKFSDVRKLANSQQQHIRKTERAHETEPTFERKQLSAQQQHQTTTFPIATLPHPPPPHVLIIMQCPCHTCRNMCVFFVFCYPGGNNAASINKSGTKT